MKRLARSGIAPPSLRRMAPARIAIIEPGNSKAELLYHFCVNFWGFDASFPKLLTPGEKEVLHGIAHSLSDPEIALQLGCSSGTIPTHRRKLMRKLEIHSTPKLIRYGIDTGFDSGPIIACDA